MPETPPAEPRPRPRQDRPLVLRRIGHLATFDGPDGAGRELAGADVVCEDGVVTAIGADLDVPAGAEVVDCSDLLVLPGLVNPHQHLYQVALRAIPELERSLIGPWLGGLGARCLRWWREGSLTPAMIGAVSAAGLAESVLGGVTTVADQHYLHPAGPTQPFIEATIDAALGVGVRLHATRGTLTLGRGQGGGADPALVQDVDEVLRHADELIRAHHDPTDGAYVRVDLAPCGVHADLFETFRGFAELAADHERVRLHTHLYEVVDTGFCAERYGMSPWEVLVEVGWAQPRTWLAHVVDPPLHELPDIAAAGVTVAHLVAPDLRMGWGRAPVREMLDAGITVGFGTTGSASNDGANVLGDLRVAALAHRVGDDPDRWLSARELLAMATRGSAACLGRAGELGVVAVGAAADLAAWDLTTVDRVGVRDPLLGLVLCGLSDRAHTVVVGGRPVVRDGRLVTADEDEVAARARALVPA
ncbi:amidohydrolase family protein [Dermatobacter hominis]|uniref:amidohydrolase family protein n=1 Tax=Dermatobacter hominis TaxID=2884263 RepID=UPI001D0FAAA3|nr:amidohydrolase family protein [Dermatobacter hominis]UDY35474.1 amidohydrolase family protein [Dermatobacter hominis]